MKRATKILLVSAVLLVLFAGVAVAATIRCNVTNCPGTPQNDTIIGNNLDQNFNAKDGKDTVRAGGGDDDVEGNPGNDRLLGEAGCDKVVGGIGVDIIDIQSGDNCAKGVNVAGHEIGDAVDGLPFDRVLSRDGEPDEIRCDTDDQIRGDVGVDFFRTSGGASGFLPSPTFLCP